MRHLFIFIAALCIYTGSPAQDTVKATPAAIKAKNFANPTFPFIVSLTSQEYDVTVDLNDPKVIGKYREVFQQNNKPFTPDGWEDVITGLLENKDPAFAQQIITAAHEGVLRIGTGGSEYQQKFMDYIYPKFADVKELEKFLKDGE